MSFPTINLLAIIVAAIVHVIIGALWFNTPFLFRDAWLAGIGKTAEQVAAEFSPLKPFTALIGALLIGGLLALVIGWSGASGPLQGVLIGLLVAVCFAAVTSGVKDLFEGRSAKLWFIHAGHDMVALALMGFIIGLWRT